MFKGLCCWGTDYCKCGCLGLSRNQNIKFTYHFVIIITYVLLMILQSIIPTPSEYLINHDGCEDYVNKEQCIWTEIKFRCILGISLMHFMLFLLMMMRNQTSKILNEGAWLSKIAFIIIMDILFIYAIPNSIVSSIHSFSVYLSLFWWFIQNLIIIDLIHAFDVRIKELAQQNARIPAVKAILAILVLTAAIVLNVSGYFSEFQQYRYVHIANSVLMVIFVCVVFLRIVPTNTLLACVLILLYLNLISYYIPQSQHESGFMYPGKRILVVVVLLGFLSPGSNKIRTKKATFSQILALNTSRQEEDNRYVSSNKWIVYHYILFCLCLCIPIFVDCQSNSKGEWTDVLLDGYGVVGWISGYLIYLWTIICAKLYPEQDFSQLENYFKQFELN